MVEYHIRRDGATKGEGEGEVENDNIGACSTVGESTQVVERHVRRGRPQVWVPLGSTLEHGQHHNITKARWE